MSQLKYFLYCFLFSLVSLPLSAQDYIVNVQQYGIEDGLENRDVKALFKDNNGFLWLAFADGLQRYDGYTFKSYPLVSSKGRFTNIQSIGQNKDGWLRLITLDEASSQQDIFFMHPFTGETQTKEERFGAEIAAVLSPFLNVKEYKFFKQRDANLFYFTNKNKIIFLDAQNHIQIWDIPLSSKGKFFLDIKLIDHLGHLWVYNENERSLYKINKQGKTIAIFPIYNIKNHGESVFEWEENIYLKSAKSVSGKLWDYLYQVDSNNQQQLFFKAPEGFSIHQFLDGKIWCIGHTGWKVFDISGTLLFEMTRADYSNALFDGLTFSHSFSDETGKVYLSSEFGFNIIDVRKNPFTQYFTNNKERPLPINNSARGIYADSTQIIVNFEFGGLVAFQKKKKGDFKIISTESYPNSEYLSRPVLMDSEQHIWTGHDVRLSRWSTDFSEEKKITTTYKTTFQNAQPWALWEDEAGCIWTSYLKNIAIKCKEDSLQVLFSNADVGIDFIDLNIYQFLPDTASFLWLCTGKGLYHFDKETKHVLHHYHSNGQGEYALPADDIFHLYIDKNQNKWLATRKGLIFWNTKTGEKRLFNRNDGLSNDVIYAVYEDQHNRLWLSSDYGIMSFDKTTFDVRTYLPKDGVAQNEFNRISHFQDKDGRIYFGGLNGVTTFHPDDFIDDTKVDYAQLLISEYELFDGKSGKILNKIKEITETNTIIFRPDDRFFKLKFTLPTFEDIDKTLYAWKIEGVYDHWTYQKENSLQLAALPYGKYVLQIKGQGAKGGWSPHDLKININVVKPFYLQFWFFTLCLVLLGIGIWRYNRYRIRQFSIRQQKLQQEVALATSKINEDKKTIEKQADELLQLDKMKSRFFANVSHELRTPLTLILGPINAAIKSGTLNNRNFTHLQKAKKNGKDLLKLVASILDLSKMESGKLEVSEKPLLLFKLMRRMTSAFESHAQRNEIELVFDYRAEKSLQLQLDEEKLATILNNLLSNAIKFTPPKGKIIVKTEDKGNTILLSVNDTGRGIHPDDVPMVFDRFYQTKQKNAPTEGGTGIGLALCQELTKIMNGKIWLESELGKGSTFFVQLKRIEIMGIAESEVLTTETLKIPDAIAETEVIDNTPDAQKEHQLLIVEDNHELRDYIQSILSPYYNITTAKNGQEALNCLNKTSSFHLILSDIMMPVMDGFQLLEKLKATDQYRHIPVIMLTARADMQDKLKALRIGVDDYLLKPFEEEELLVRIENLLDSRAHRSTFFTENDTVVEDHTLSISAQDQLWLESYEAGLKKQLSNSSYALAQMAADQAMSISTLTRQLKRLTGLTPARYFQAIRLNEARQLLETKSFSTITEVAYQVGFSDVTAFNRAFKRHYGKSPSEF